jgi:helicase required for RNAi-mediated heterochromatin assembly 1
MGQWLSRSEIPTSDEIRDVQEAWVPRDRIDGAIILNGNKIKGSWNSQEEYLRTHYELFREEAVRPLREAVNFLQQCPDYQEHNNGGKNLGVYDRVRIKALTFAYRGLAVRVTFSLCRVGKNIRWDQSRRLLSGSLVALTTKDDMFKSICKVAVVAARPLDGLRLNPPQIDLFFAHPNELELDPDTEWLMIEERSSFFEAQRHIMTALQKMTIEPFPLSEHLVDMQENVLPPEYVCEQPSMDMSEIFQSTPGDRTYERMDLRKWPEQPPTTLDSSQLSALQRILTKRLSLIQGPPGTGKTHVSVVALKALLSNMSFYDTPIIIACQTNHALDQLLRHVAQFEPDFARLGGRSKDTSIIKQRTLFALRQDERKQGFHGTGSCRSFHRGRLADIQKEMCLLLSPMAKGQSNNQESKRKGLLDHNLLKKFGLLTQAQCDSLERGDTQWANHGSTSGDEIPLKQWLGSQFTTINHCTQSENFGFIYEDADLEVEQLQEIEAEAIAQDDEDDFERLKGTTMELLDDIAGKKDPSLTDEQIQKLLRQQDMWVIKPRQRGSVFEYLRRQAKAYITAALREKAGVYYERASQFRAAGWEDDWPLLRKQKVIGMTTTGLSKYRALVSSLEPKIVLIEEAAETLEGPVTAACVPSVQHLILVGDHKQLRPQCGVKELETDEYSFNVSLFERLVNNNIEFSMLQRQRRMIPEIRRILRPIYGDAITDHPSVSDPTIRPPVPGMGGVNSFLFTHEWPETKDEQMSVKNETEGDMIVGFFDYLIHNGVTEDQITILTFYNGQRKLILEKLRKHPNLGIGKKAFNVVTVDSYQGEENDVILLSLVRSNNQGTVGFLNVDNRVCVALSRAKCGFYIFGNAQLLATETKTWAKVVEIMAGKKKPYPQSEPKCRLGYHLRITCKNHGRLTFINDPSQWCNLHGGCEMKCKNVLPCGHKCPLQCHPFAHDQVNCTHICGRILKCTHRCEDYCGEPCHCAQCDFDYGRLSEHRHLENKSATDSGSTQRDWQIFANGGVREHDKRLKQKQTADRMRQKQEFEARIKELNQQPVADPLERLQPKTPSPPIVSPNDGIIIHQTRGNGRYRWTETFGMGSSPKPRPTQVQSPKQLPQVSEEEEELLIDLS